MKRLIVFALLELMIFGLVGAPLWTGAGLSLFAFAFWHTELSADTLREMASLFVTMFPYTIAYASLLALFDFALFGLKMPYRWMICALFGLCSMVWMFADLAQPMKLIAVGLLGALPAALCSCLFAVIAERAIAATPSSNQEASAASPG